MAYYVKPATHTRIDSIKAGKDSRNTSKYGCVIRDSAMALSQALAPDQGGMPGMFQAYSKADVQDSGIKKGGLASYDTPERAER